MDRSQLGSAEVNVTMPVGLDSQHLGYLLAFVYGQKDLNGKPITCERLKMEKNPASRILARYYPPRDWSTIYGIPNAQAGSSYRLLMDGKTIPAGKRTLLVLGFCRTDDGRPEFTEETGFKITWQACKENVEIKPGESNDISIKLPISETCD